MKVDLIVKVTATLNATDEKAINEKEISEKDIDWVDYISCRDEVELLAINVDHSNRRQ